MKILITGATGLIGKELGRALVAKGHEIAILTRNAERAKERMPFPCEVIEGDTTKGPLPNPARLRSIEGVINLMGESVGEGRWSEGRKTRIYESRVLGTRHLIESLPTPPKIFINASAAGFYGSQGDELLDEESASGEDFLAQVCQDWEEELLALSYGGEGISDTRVVALRTGLVLAPTGGVLDKLKPLFKMGLGSVLGDGKQWMSWIHIEDLVALVLLALEKPTLKGAINVSSPNPARNEDFSRALAKVYDKGLLPRVPAVVLMLALGEMSILVLGSQRMIPKKALDSGFKFKFPSLEKALRDVSGVKK